MSWKNGVAPPGRWDGRASSLFQGHVGMGWVHQWAKGAEFRGPRWAGPRVAPRGTLSGARFLKNAMSWKNVGRSPRTMGWPGEFVILGACGHGVGPPMGQGGEF
jgi:hypothetical protein